MVGSVGKREAVAHLQSVMGWSERRARSFVGADCKMIRYRSCRPPETELRGRCAILPMSVAGLAIGGCRYVGARGTSSLNSQFLGEGDSSARINARLHANFKFFSTLMRPATLRGHIDTSPSAAAVSIDA